MFLGSDVLLLLSIPLYNILLKITQRDHTFTVWKDLCLYLNYHGENNINCIQDISMQSKCLINQKKKIKKQKAVYNIIKTISLRLQNCFIW